MRFHIRGVRAAMMVLAVGVAVLAMLPPPVAAQPSNDDMDGDQKPVLGLVALEPRGEGADGMAREIRDAIRFSDAVTSHFDARALPGLADGFDVAALAELAREHECRWLLGGSLYRDAANWFTLRLFVFDAASNHFARMKRHTAIAGRDLYANAENLAAAWLAELAAPVPDSKADPDAAPETPALPAWLAAEHRDALTANLHAAVIDGCNEENGRKLTDGGFDYRGIESIITAADAERGLAVLFVRQNEAVYLRWDRLAPHETLGVYRLLANRTIEEDWAMAVVAMRLGMEFDVASEILFSVWQRAPELKPAIDALLAEIRGGEVPEGGFVPVETVDGGRFLSAADAAIFTGSTAAIKAIAMAIRFAATRNSSDMSALRLLIDRLKPLRGAALDSAVDIFNGEIRSRAADLAHVIEPRRNLLTRLEFDLFAARDAALKLIFDLEKYPNENHGAAGQADVDAAIDRVREIWERSEIEPLTDRTTMKQFAEIELLHSLLGEFAAEHARIAAGISDAELEIFREGIRASSIREFASSADDAARLAEFAAIMQDNDATNSPAMANEKAFARAINEYRHMLGLHALRINPKLIDAARGHAKFMKVSVQFGHDLPGHPDGESPGDRARKYGYASGVGEIIAMNSRGYSAQTVFAAWYHSSKNHRQMLGANWKVLGIGDGGTHWVLMLGSNRDGSEPSSH